MKFSNFSNHKIKIICKDDENAIFFLFYIIISKKNVCEKDRVKDIKTKNLNDSYMLNKKEKRKKK